AAGFLISNKALQQDLQGNQFVYVIENNTAQKREVKTIALIDKKILVSGNLKEGDEIIIAGQDKLRQSSLINIAQ
ncbi:MAG: efflux transporter periplasmic adaptor subunit, partial [Sphingobacteriia bacterium 35-40-5]